MSEDSGLYSYKRRLIKNHMANELANNAFYDRNTKNPNAVTQATAVQACTNCQYPGSFTKAGLYVYGEQKYPADPDYDRSMAQQRRYDKPYIDYISTEAFKNTFDMQDMVVVDNLGRVPLTGPRVKPGYFTPTGYRTPSQLDKQIHLARERRQEAAYDFY